MRVVHIVHGRANPDGHNGISRVVYQLNKFQKKLGHQSEIWAIVDGATGRSTHRRDEHVSVECFPRVKVPWGVNPIIEALMAERSSVDIVHLHLIWFYDKNIIAAALRRAEIPFVITTHGTYATKHAFTGKRIVAKWLYELRYLRMATELHALTSEEAESYAKYGYAGPAFIVPNGFDLQDIPATVNSDYFGEKPYAHKLKFLWVGVLRDDKNLRSLIAAVARLTRELREQLCVVLVGPDYKGNREKYVELSRKLGCEDCFDFVGPLYGTAKFDAICSADVYVMPSISEGFSLSILDAVACSRPCLLTFGCGMSEIFSEETVVRCGTTPEELAAGMQAMLRRKHEWDEMGRRGRRLLEQQLTWEAVARDMATQYRRIVEVGHNVDG